MNKIKWCNITVSQYYILEEQLKGIEGSERLFKAGCLIHGLDIEKESKKGMDRFFQIAQSVDFLAGGDFEPKNDIEIGGKRHLFKPAHFLSGNEFMDIQNILATDTTMFDKTIDIFARLCAEPEVRHLASVDAHIQKDIVAKWRKHVEAMTMQDFFCLEAFFLTSGKDLQKIFLQSLVRRANASTKTMMQESELQATHSKGFIRFLQPLQKKIQRLYIRNLRNLLALRYSNIVYGWKTNKD